MKPSTKIVIPKKRGPKPTGQGKPVVVRLQPDLLDGLDAFRADHKANRPEALRMILRDFLISHGIQPQ